MADTGNDRIQKFTSDGQFLAKWGGKGHDPGDFDYASDVAVDSAGIVFVCDHFNNRIQVFIEGWNDILASSDHVMHSLVAFVRGSWFGVGVGRGTTKLTTLPFAHTDSVFAVVGEEIGVFGASFLVVLYALLFWRGLVIARRAPDGLGSLLAAGLTQ